MWDALRTNAYDGKRNRYALAETVRHTSLGTWSDGTPVIPLVVQKAAPLVATLVPGT